MSPAALTFSSFERQSLALPSTLKISKTLVGHIIECSGKSGPLVRVSIILAAESSSSVEFRKRKMNTHIEAQVTHSLTVIRDTSSVDANNATSADPIRIMINNLPKSPGIIAKARRGSTRIRGNPSTADWTGPTPLALLAGLVRATENRSFLWSKNRDSHLSTGACFSIQVRYT